MYLPNLAYESKHFYGITAMAQLHRRSSGHNLIAFVSKVYPIIMEYNLENLLKSADWLVGDGGGG